MDVFETRGSDLVLPLRYRRGMCQYGIHITPSPTACPPVHLALAPGRNSAIVNGQALQGWAELTLGYNSQAR